MEILPILSRNTKSNSVEVSYKDYTRAADLYREQKFMLEDLKDKVRVLESNNADYRRSQWLLIIFSILMIFIVCLSD